MVLVMLTSLLLSLLLAQTAQARYCVQLQTLQDGARVEASYALVSDMPKARVEKMQDFYVLRVGQADTPEALQEVLTDVRGRAPEEFSDAYIRDCLYTPERIVIPGQRAAAEAEEKAPNRPEEQRLARVATANPDVPTTRAVVPDNAITPGRKDPTSRNGSGIQLQPGGPEDRITLNVKDTDINDVLKFLSLQRRVNIVAGKDVSGLVSVNLYDVPFDLALEAILKSNGFTAQRQDNVIFVTKAVAQSDSAPRQVPTAVRTFRLNYANIPETAEMVKQLLSSQGKMVVGKESKRLLIEDTVDTVEKIGMLLQGLDIKPRQVLIEARILEVRLDNDTALGINWDTLFGRNSAGDRLGRASTQGFATNPLFGAPGFFFSIVNQDITVLLSALQERRKLNTLANPKILTVDGREAEILIGAKLGYRVTTTTQTATLESVQFLDVGTELVIRPSIGDDGFILMNVHPKVSDGSVTAGLPTENTTEATTSVLLKDGETIIIGGLIRERDEETRTQVPVLSDIPVLGSLFRNRRTAKEKTEIAVLITPHIVQDAPPAIAAAQAPGTPQPAGLPPRLRKLWDTDFVMALSKAL